MTPTRPVFPTRRFDFVPPREVVFAKDQPEYLPLPAAVESNGRVTTRWKLTWRERFKLFFTGDLWLEVLTFNRPLQPVKLSVEEPALKDAGEL